MSRRRQREGAGPKPAPWRAEKAAMDMVMGGAITAVAATTTVGIGATTMAGGIIAIGGDFLPREASTHPGKLDLLPLVQFLVELRQRRTDSGCRLTHGHETRAQLGHAGGRRKCGLGGAGARECVGDLERRGNELV